MKETKTTITRIMRNFVISIFLLATSLATAQSIVISESESTPDASALVDMQSGSKGMLIPRMTLNERVNIASPAEGLTVYQTDDVSGFYYYTGTSWTAFVNTQQVTSFGSGQVITSAERESLNSALQEETDPLFSSQIMDVGSGRVISSTERDSLKSAVQEETDPIYSGSPASDFTTDEVSYLRNLVSGTGGVPPGTIVPFAGEVSNIPDGWLLCDGSPKLRSEFAVLFNVIGVSWGAGDGSNTFNLPNLGGRFLRGAQYADGDDPDFADRVGGEGNEKVGSYQDPASMLPNSGWIVSEGGDHTHSSSLSGTTAEAGNHRHKLTVPELNNGTEGGNYLTQHVRFDDQSIDSYNLGGSVEQPNGYDSGVSGAHTHSVTVSGTTDLAGAHTHVVSGGDAETRPKNASVNYIIKY